MNKCKIVSKEYYSNCLIEAIKAKFKDFKHTKLYFCKPRIINGSFQMFHFMWSDGKADYDFTDSEEIEMPWYKNFIFKGVIRKFDLGFAEEYSKYRNK